MLIASVAAPALSNASVTLRSVDASALDQAVPGGRVGDAERRSCLIRDRVGKPDELRRWNRDVFGAAARRLDAEEPRVAAIVLARAGAAEVAVAARDDRIDRDALADAEVSNPRSELDDLTGGVGPADVGHRKLAHRESVAARLDIRPVAHRDGVYRDENFSGPGPWGRDRGGLEHVAVAVLIENDRPQVSPPLPRPCGRPVENSIELWYRS